MVHYHQPCITQWTFFSPLLLSFKQQSCQISNQGLHSGAMQNMIFLKFFGIKKPLMTKRKTKGEGDQQREIGTECWETNRPGEWKTVRPGDQKTKKAEDRETGRLGDRETGRSGNQETRKPGDRETRRPGDWETGRPGDQETRRPGDWERELSGRFNNNTK